MAVEYVIRSEQDAWDLLEKLNSDEIDFHKEVASLKFDGWPELNLKFSGHVFDQSIPTRVMPPLIQAQKEMHRLFCEARYGEVNLRKLSRDDRDRLELVVKVDEGSSEYKTNLDIQLTEIVKSAVSHMTPEHIFYSVIVGALSWGSVVAWKAYLKNKTEEREIESRIKMSELEAEKLKVFERATRDTPRLEQISQGVDEFRNSSLHALKTSDNFDLIGTDVNVDGQHASEITYTPRAESTEVRLDGDFIILSVDSGGTKGFRLKVQRIDEDTTMIVSIPDGTLSKKQKEVLQKNEWAKKAVRLQINAKELRGQITAATLVKASQIEKK